MMCAACGAKTDAAPCVRCGSEPRLGGRYALESRLEEGDGGATWRAAGPDGAPVALKVVYLKPSMGDDERQALSRSIEALLVLDHPQVAAYTDEFTARMGRSRYRCVAQSLIAGRDLGREIAAQRPTYLRSMAILAELASVLEDMHAAIPPVAHGDLRLENVARRESDGALVLIDCRVGGGATPEGDIHALGELGVWLLTGGPPGQAKGALWFWPDDLPDPMGRFVDDLLASDPRARPSAGRAAARARSLSRLPDEAQAPDPELGGPRPELNAPPGPSKKREIAATPEAPIDRIWRTSASAQRQLYTLQGVAAIAAAAAAFWEIESIMVSGGLGSLLGILIGGRALRAGLPIGAVAGLSTPALSAVLFAIIAAFNVGPGDASAWVPILLVGYAAAMMGVLTASTGELKALDRD